MSAKLSVSEEKPVLKKFFCVNQYKEKKMKKYKFCLRCFSLVSIIKSAIIFPIHTRGVHKTFEELETKEDFRN